LDLRTPSQGADSIVWLSVADKVKRETGKLWFDREVQSAHMPLSQTKSSPEEVDTLYKYCQSFMKEEEGKEEVEEKSTE
jgi:hypothetical protein